MRMSTIGPALGRILAASEKGVWPWLAMVVVLAATVGQLRNQGRPWWCSCGQAFLWTAEANGRHNSQHLLDPYSFTHMLHGVAFCGLLAWCFPKAGPGRQFGMNLCMEAAWELFENSAYIIERYRTATIALGYQGDSIVNAFGDILSCGIGWVIAWRLGLRGSILLFAVTEVVLLLWIKDSLLLNILMLVRPIEAIKTWQTG